MTEQVFPSALTNIVAFPVVMKPMYRTIIQTAASGKEQRVALWNYARRVYTLTWEFMRDDATHNEWDTMLSFWLSLQGRFSTFLFNDPSDNAATGQLIGIGDGVTTQFQLARTINSSWTEAINAPNIVSHVYVNGVDPGGWSVNSATGVITLASPAPNGQAVSADFTFYFRCRLLNDEDEFEKFGSTLWEKKTLEFITVKS